MILSCDMPEQEELSQHQNSPFLREYTKDQNQAQPLGNTSQNSESGVRPQKAETVENMATVRDNGASSSSAQPHSSRGQSF